MTWVPRQAIAVRSGNFANQAVGTQQTKQGLVVVALIDGVVLIVLHFCAAQPGTVTRARASDRQRAGAEAKHV